MVQTHVHVPIFCRRRFFMLNARLVTLLVLCEVRRRKKARSLLSCFSCLSQCIGFGLVFLFSSAQSLPILSRCISRLLPARASSETQLVLVLVLVFARAQSLPIFNRCISRLLPARASSCTATPTAGHSWLPRRYGVVIYFAALVLLREGRISGCAASTSGG